MNNSPEFWDNFEEHIAYWRCNVHRFIIEYLDIPLHDFQKVAVFQMYSGTDFEFWASRGIGKTWLCSVFAASMCILFPNIKIRVASASLKQSIQFIGKIQEIKRDNPVLEEEIESITSNKEEGEIIFHNGSTISTIVSNDNARGERCQILILDEGRLMNHGIVSTVLEPFMTEKRNPPYLNNPKYKKYKNMEKNREIFLSSIGTVDEWTYNGFVKKCRFIAKGDTKYHVMSLPYQIGVEAGVIDGEFIEKQLREGKSDIETFKMEMEVIPYGEAESSLFSFEQMNKTRKLKFPMIPMTSDEYLKFDGDITKNPFFKKKVPGEIRIIGMDFATSDKKDADNSVIMFMSLFENLKKDGTLDYTKELSYIEVMHGVEMDNQILRLKQVFYDLDADYAAIDCNGAIGIEAYNTCKGQTIDYDRDTRYPSWRLMPISPSVDEKDIDDTAEPVVYAIKTSGASATEVLYGMYLKSKINLERDKIKMLVHEDNCEEELNKRFKFFELKMSTSAEDRRRAARMIAPFRNISELVEEAIKTQKVDIKTNKFSIKEKKRTDRKDRIMTFIYMLWFASILEEKLNGKISSFDYDNVYRAKSSGGGKRGGVAFQERGSKSCFNPFGRRLRG